MAKRELTAEELETRKVSLAKGRATAAANRAKREADTSGVHPLKSIDTIDPKTEVSVEEPPAEEAPLRLGDDELARIRAEAKKKVDAEVAAANSEKRKKLVAKELDAEILRQRKDAGLIDYRDDLLEILIDVAPFSDNIAIDGVIYQHGTWYTVDRRRYDSLREIMARSWDSEERAGNPNRKFRREVAGSMNPMANERRLRDGTLTVGYDPGVNARIGSVVGG